MQRPELDWPLDQFDIEPAGINGDKRSLPLTFFLPLRPTVPASSVALAHQWREPCQHSHNFNLHTNA